MFDDGHYTMVAFDAHNVCISYFYKHDGGELVVVVMFF